MSDFDMRGGGGGISIFQKKSEISDRGGGVVSSLFWKKPPKMFCFFYYDASPKVYFFCSNLAGNFSDIEVEQMAPGQMSPAKMFIGQILL